MENFACPCCGYKTFDVQPDGTYLICPVCSWEDDPIQLANRDYEGGANGVSLRQAQANFNLLGACKIEMLKNVRSPKREEERDENWTILD